MKASYQIGEDVCVIGGHHSQLSCLQCEEKEIREEKLTRAAFIWPTKPQCKAEQSILGGSQVALEVRG